MGKIFMLIGKSATGKDHIYKKLLSKLSGKAEPLVMHTTRPKRKGEIDGREYHFTDTEGLKRLRAAGKVIEERVYSTVHGDWYYFTADDGQIRLDRTNYLVIGTLEAYNAMRRFFGGGRVVPLYIEVSDAVRIRRAVEREAVQQEPAFSEVCRRYLADEEDFSEEKLKEAGITKRYSNDGEPEECIRAITEAVETGLKEGLS